jgi:SAM-dependent methyltransferase
MTHRFNQRILKKSPVLWKMKYQPRQVQIESGIPVLAEYDRELSNPLFRRMEQFSDGFLAKNGSLLDAFVKTWVRDPLHQWSRRWEYPFAYECLNAGFGGRAGVRILDAGSGVTFFPYFLTSENPGWQVAACDYDTRFQEIFARLKENGGETSGGNVSFTAADMRALPFKAASFDAVYCISVLEHTGEYPKILDEFSRILKPGGRLILTFDISLDGYLQLDRAQAGHFLEEVGRRFKPAGPAASGPAQILARLNSPADGAIVTSRAVCAREPATMPWKYPRLSALKASLPRGKIALSLNLSFACLDLMKN